jgi:hypothetical protein
LSKSGFLRAQQAVLQRAGPDQDKLHREFSIPREVAR